MSFARAAQDSAKPTKKRAKIRRLVLTGNFLHNPRCPTPAERLQGALHGRFPSNLRVPRQHDPVIGPKALARTSPVGRPNRLRHGACSVEVITTLLHSS
jgi:hypothetical protein